MATLGKTGVNSAGITAINNAANASALTVTAYGDVTGGAYGINATSTARRDDRHRPWYGDGHHPRHLCGAHQRGGRAPQHHHRGRHRRRGRHFARSFGTGALTIEANGDVEGSSQNGIYARNFSVSEAPLSVTTKQSPAARTAL